MRHLLACLLAMTIHLPLAGADGPWLTELEAAKGVAAKTDKDLLLFFTGSDWCPPCIRLKENVLSKEVFINGVSQRFVLVEFDFPRHRELPAEHRQRNEAARSHYGVEGYPSLLLADDQGRPYAQAGFSQDDAATYTARLIEQQALRQQRDEALDMADELSGAEQGRALAAVLEVLKGRGLSLRPYRAEIDTIIDSDPDAEAAYAAPFRNQVVLWDLHEVLQQALTAHEAGGGAPDFAALINRFGHVTEAHQQILFGQAAVTIKDGDRAQAIELLQQAHALDPDSETGQQLSQILQRLGQ